MLLDLGADGVAVLIGHDDVGDDHVGAVLFELGECGSGVGAGDDVDVLAAERDFDDFAHGGAVVNEIDGGRALGFYRRAVLRFAVTFRRCRRHGHQFIHRVAHRASVSAMSRAVSSYSRMASSMRSVAERRTVRCARGRAVHKFVNASAALHAALHNVDDGFVAEESAAFGVSDFAGVEEEHRVGFAGVDVKRAGLVRVAEHLHHAGKIVMREAAAEAGVRLARAFAWAESLRLC